MRRCDNERGVVAVEALFVLLVWALLFMIILRIHQLREHMQVARAEAHRQTYWKSTTEYDIYPSGTNLPSNGVTSWIYNQLVGHPILQVAPLPSLSPAAPNWLSPANLPIDGVEGWGWGDYGQVVLPSWTAGFAGQPSDLRITRFASSRRSSWTWTGAPFVWTQDWSEKNHIQTWYTTAYDHCITPNEQSLFQLNTAPK